jgi:nucleotide-binding universal stress UspA family protein
MAKCSDQPLSDDQMRGGGCHAVETVPTSEGRIAGIARMVVAVDGSPAATAAARWAAFEAAMRDVDLTIVHVQQSAPGAWLETGWPVIAIPTEVREHQLAQRDKVLETTLEVIAKTIGPHRPRRVTTKLCVGAVAPILAGFSRKESDMIAVGRRGKGGIHRTLLGSVSSSVLRAAQCPVVVVHHQLLPAPSPDSPVVVGIDGSAASERASAIAFDEASRRAVDLVAVHAIAGPETPHTQELLTRSLAGLQYRYPDVGVRRVVAGAHPADALLAESQHAQLVVVGSRGRRGLTGRLRGSVGAAVVQACRTPVIVVPGHDIPDSSGSHHMLLVNAKRW